MPQGRPSGLPPSLLSLIPVPLSIPLPRPSLTLPQERPTCFDLLRHPFLKAAATKDHMKALADSIFNKKKEIIVVSSDDDSVQS